MRVVELPDIRAALDRDEILTALEAGFRAASAGTVRSMAVGHLEFEVPPGDCHVKGAYLDGDDVFVVKLATSFYRNPERGLSSSNGLNLVLSARTGEVAAILNDQGLLTDTRTAAASAIVAKAIARSGTACLGLVGTGTQARLHAEWIGRVFKLERILIWGRDAAKAAKLASEIGGEAVSLQHLVSSADLIVTTTPSKVPIIVDDMVKPGMRIIAVGADAQGKSEIDPLVFARARAVVDSRAQCADHGDSSQAIRNGFVAETDLIEVGDMLARKIRFAPDDIVIADMTGIAIHDVQISKAVWSRLSRRGM